MPYEQNDVVRLVRVDAGTMVSPYLGQEGRVVKRSPDLKLYLIEIDVGRATPDRGGQLGPRFVVREDQIDPDVTEKMIDAANALFVEHDDPPTPAAIYRAMRAARFER